MMNIYTYLKKDHRAVSALMEEVLSTHNPEKQEELFERIKEELELHADTEEKTFYVAIKNKGGKLLKEKEDHAEEEHAEIRNFLKQIEVAKPGSNDWLIAFGELKHAVEHHVEEEESDIFEKAKKVLSDAQAYELALEMDEMKKDKQRHKGLGKNSNDGKTLLQRIIF